MNAPRVPASILLAAGLLLGVIGDGLLRPGGPPGLNLFLWTAALAAAVMLVGRRGGITLSAEAIVWLGVGVLFAGGLAWRDAPALKVLALAAASTAFALPAFRAGAAWVRQSGVLGYAGAVAAAAVHTGLGGILVLGDVDWGSLRGHAAHDARWRRALSVARGIAIAVPLLVVFGGLFIAADAVFAEMAADALRLDLERVVSHILLVGFFGWVATGYLRGFVSGAQFSELKTLAPRRPVLGIAETGIVLALLDLLFLAFVVVQFRYLFGGSELVEVTPGLTYSEYARRGFFELVAAAVLMLPLLLAADWLLRCERRRDEWIFRVLAGLQILLMLAVMASAFQRMRLYQSAYGLTEQRLYATALLVWLGVMFLWFAATVLRGHARAFAFGALTSALVGIAGLYAINPDAVIARTNAARALAGAPFDVRYATSLSADAVPTLLAAFPELPEEARCPIARRLLERWSSNAAADWRTWSWSTSRARAAVRAEAPRLHAAADFGGSCRETRSRATG